MPGVLALALSLLCLAVNAFFVAAEFALVKVRVTQLDRALRRGDRRAHAAKEVLSRLDRYLSVTQFGITVASLGLGWIGEPALERLGDAVALAVTGAPLGSAGHVVVDVLGLGVLTFLHLLLGELVPKFIAIQYAEATSLFAAIPLRLVNTVFRPLLWGLEGAQRAVLRAIHIDPEKANEGTLSEDEIIGILAAAATRDPKTQDKQRLVERVLRFGNRPVRQMMVPRVDVVWLRIDATGERAYEVLLAHGFSRVPVVRESLDDIAGYLYAKDFLFDPAARARSTLHGLERRVHFVPETQDGLTALRDMQQQNVTFAVVVDEYGGTSGILTLEDLVEEVVGDLKDELDDEQRAITPVPGMPDTWDVDARAHTELLRDVGVPLDDDWFGEAIGTVVLAKLGHLPRIGDVAQLGGGVLAEIVALSRRRIQRVRVRLLAQ
ncbi:MAG TPA: hemolysin family protein [Labilithrix sp.]|nr:hemolysin family protein [Labilithrix sp.]